MKCSRGGFSFIELLTVTAIIGVLSMIVVPHLTDMKRRAIAASIFADVHAIRIAAFSYHTEQEEFPPDAPAGQVPPELEPLLPKGFSFVHADYVYDWHTWSLGPSENLVGVRVSSGDEKLIAHLVRTAGPGFIPAATSSRVTFLLSSQ